MQYCAALRNKLIILLLPSILLFGFTFKHPFYLGIVHFKHNVTNNIIETDVKLFVNDLEAALKKLNNKPIDVINGTNKTELNTIINAYVRTHLVVKINGKKCDYSFVGFEVEKDVVWIYLEYKNIKAIKNLEVEASLLYDYIKQQSNIIRVECNATEQNKKLNYPEKSVKLSF